MTTVTRLHRAAGPTTLAEASRRFLRRDAFESTTRDAYGRTLAALADVLGADADLAAVTTEQLEDGLLERWSEAAVTTYNRHRAALLSFFGCCVERGYLAANPAALVEARKVRKRTEDERRERPVSRDLLAGLWALDGVAGRDRTLWRMAYETWARAEELLGLNIEDLDLANREAVVNGKGGDRERVWWATGTARLLPRVIAGRTAGPLFLASRRPTKPMPAADVDPVSGRARLSYRQAERIFAEVRRRLDPDGTPFTLHRLRHAGIAHAVEDGYSVAAIRAKSRHESLRSLEVYTNPSADSIRAMTDDLDGTARRRRQRPEAGGAP